MPLFRSILFVLFAFASGPSFSNESLVVYIECKGQDGTLSKGSGVLVDPSGRVLTARHIAPDPRATCKGAIGNKALGLRPLRYAFETRNIDDDIDAVILEFGLSKGETTDFATYCPVTDNLVGNELLAYGFHSQTFDRASVTSGILSTTRKNFFGIVETDALSSSGKSGGPVFLKDTDALIGIMAGAEFDALGLPVFYGILASDTFQNAGVFLKSELCETFEEKSAEDSTPQVDLKVEKSVSEWVSAGRLKMKDYDYGSAVKDFTKALEIDPSDANAYLGRARANAELANLKAARADYEAAAKNVSNDLNVQVAVTRYFIENDEVVLARKSAARLVADFPEAGLSHYLTARAKILPHSGSFWFSKRVPDEVLRDARLDLIRSLELDASSFRARQDLKRLCAAKPHLCEE